MIKANIQWNAKQISKMFDNNCLKFDNIIQRGNVWDVKRQSLLVDSMLKGFPVPPMYTIKSDEKVKTPKGMVSVFDVIDGKQRCTAINKFKNNQFKLTGIDSEYEGLTYDELSDDQKDTFDSYSLTVYFFTEIEEEEVAEMMSRLNNGKALSGIENARIKAKDLNSIVTLASHSLFGKSLSESAIKGYTNEDCVLKTYLQVFEKNNELSIKNVKRIYENHAFSSDEKDTLNSVFSKTENVLDKIKAERKKSIVRKALKKANFITVLYAISQNQERDVSYLANKIGAFFDNVPDSYIAVTTNGTNHSDNVSKRNKIMIDYIRS